jgi:hypothetical protein
MRGRLRIQRISCPQPKAEERGAPTTFGQKAERSLCFEITIVEVQTNLMDVCPDRETSRSDDPSRDEAIQPGLPVGHKVPPSMSSGFRPWERSPIPVKPEAAGDRIGPRMQLVALVLVKSSSSERSGMYITHRPVCGRSNCNLHQFFRLLPQPCGKLIIGSAVE